MMTKNIKYKLMGLVILATTIVACEMEDQSVSPIVAPSSSSPSFVTLTLDNALPVVEGDTLYFTAKISTPIEATITLHTTIDGSTTLEEHVDFDIYDAVIEPYTTEAKIMVVTYADVEPEEAGTIQFSFTIDGIAERYLLHPDSENPSASVTVNNFESDILDASFDWGRDIVFAGTPYPAGPNIDLDAFVSDAAGFDISDPWATFNSTNYAATGDHPEHFTFDPAAWGDGEYIIWHENWSNGFAGLGTNTLVPITATFTRAGIFSIDVIQDDSQALNSDNGGEADDVPNETHGFIAKVTIANGLFTISDYAGTDLITGKVNNTKRTPRPTSIVKK